MAMSRPTLIRTTSLLLTILSIALVLSILSVAAHLLSTYNTQRDTNIWFLPLWPSHFELRELSTLIGTGSVIFLLDGFLLFYITLRNFSWTPAAKTPLYRASGGPVETCLTGFAGLLAIIALAVPAALNLHVPPTRDTLLTWSCRWSSNRSTLENSAGSVPGEFIGLCRESRFVFYATIPLLILQCGIFGCAMATFFLDRRARREEQMELQLAGGKVVRKREFEKLKDEGSGGVALREIGFD